MPQSQAREQVNLWHVMLFFIGAFAMRGAGCTWNDIVDRDLDRRVERTRSRPIPSGQVSVAAAAVFLVRRRWSGSRCCCSSICFTVMAGIASLVVVAIYPFMKRITYWPQIVLGLAFSWGALMGWPAAFGRLDLAGLLLYAGAIAWVIGYDTIYAHQDREDDALIGIKSTALLFGERTKPMLALFYALAVAADCAGRMGGRAPACVFAFGLVAFAAHLAWQISRLDIDDPGELPRRVQVEPRRRLHSVRRDGAGRLRALACFDANVSGGFRMLQGGCFCGRIRYEVTGTPFNETNCHCSICRRTHRRAVRRVVQRAAVGVSRGVRRTRAFPVEREGHPQLLCPFAAPS